LRKHNHEARVAKGFGNSRIATVRVVRLEDDGMAITCAGMFDLIRRLFNRREGGKTEWPMMRA
jgi:hypothetical protein